ncbi:MAG: hypothetical protein MUP81_05525 [Dehalococcoidia bacterium]|nr:hypothetical protein [Dehalococcoidia bacterium]
MKNHKRKTSDYTDDKGKPKHSKYALKSRQGCESNHARHKIPVELCSLCNPR